MAEKWTWITDGTAKPFYARKKFTVTKEVKKASAKVCGLGQFLFYLNGKKVGDHELDPAWTDYRKLIQYVTFDVTEYLKQGENVLGAEVGNGWYILMDEHYIFHFPPFMPPNPNEYKPFGKSLVLALDLTIDYADGTREKIFADDSFCTKEHPVVMSNVYGSETIDGRLAQPGWADVDFDDSGWDAAQIVDEEDVPNGEVIDQFQPAVKVLKTYPGKYLHTVNGHDIYDFGQNMSGILEFQIKGKAGDKVNIYPAEKLDAAGDVDQMAKGWLPIDVCITYIIGQDDVWETCRMKFTYFAGREIGIEKIPCTAGKVCTSSAAGRADAGAADMQPADKTSEAEAAGTQTADMASDAGAADAKAAETAGDAARIQIRNVKADAISSAWKTDGEFDCDDRRYLQIYDLVEKAVEANMIGVHTDCPTIERFAWQEPNHLMGGAIMYMKDCRRMWEKILLDMRKAQHTADDYFYDMEGGKFYPGEGLYPSQCPCYMPNVLPTPGMGSFYDIIAWGSTGILGTNWHYTFYGDKKIIEDNYDAGMRYLAHLKTKVNEHGFINHGLGDWGNPRNELARENTETVFLYADAVTLAKFAGILGKEEDQKELLAYAEQVKKNYNDKLLVRHPEKGYWCYRAWDHRDAAFMTQAVEAMPLYFGMVPSDKEADVVQAFKDTLEREGAFISGEVGLPYIIQTAAKYDMNDLICEFILKEEHPSYYAFVLDGETTLGEYWETNPRSHCHDMMGHIIEWYYNGIAGIRPEEPGFKKISIRPYLPKSMNTFTCTYHSVQGPITVHVKRADGRAVLDVQVPDGVEYTVDESRLQ